VTAPTVAVDPSYQDAYLDSSYLVDVIWTITTSDDTAANGQIAVTCTTSDGQTTTIAGDGSVTFTFSETGTYTLSCTATDPSGNTGTSNEATVLVAML